MQLQQIINSEQAKKEERLETRVTLDLKRRLQHAAELQGSSLSEFLIRSAEKTANEVIREHQILKFATEDSHAFVAALFNPPKPNKQLQSAYLRYKKEISSQP